tara:strand:+ start:279 stop:638 length:360 start_codon:yes stop_codon:yes gene_type:complete
MGGEIMLYEKLDLRKHKIIKAEDDWIETVTFDAGQTILENQGAVALDRDALIGAEITAIEYNNFIVRDEIDVSNIILGLKLKDGSERLWVIQRDEENNGGGYIAEYDSNGDMIFNEEQE